MLANKDNKEILQTSPLSWIERLTVPHLDFLSLLWDLGSIKVLSLSRDLKNWYISCGIKIKFPKYAAITNTSLIIDGRHSSSLIQWET